MAANKSSRKNDVITTFYHPFGDSGKHLRVGSDCWPEVGVDRYDGSKFVPRVSHLTAPGLRSCFIGSGHVDVSKRFSRSISLAVYCLSTIGMTFFHSYFFFLSEMSYFRP